LVPAALRIGNAVMGMHRNAEAGASFYVEASGGRGAETVLGLTSGPHAYHLFLDTRTGKVTTDLGLAGQRMEGAFGRRAVLREERTALRPALEKLAARASSQLNSPLRGFLPKAMRRDDELVLSLATAHRLLRRF
jgi:hypothetical protein